MIYYLILLSSILSEANRKLNNINALTCHFAETLKIDNGTFTFMGKIYLTHEVTRIDVEKPDTQNILFRNDSVYIYLKKSDIFKKSISPISFSKLIFSTEKYYRVDSTSGRTVFLFPRDSTISYPVSIQFNQSLLPEIICFKQESGRGKFILSDYRINPAFNHKILEINSINR